MKVIRVELETNRAERVDLVGAVARVEFGEVAAEHAVFDRRQDLIANPFVERHPAPECSTAVDHPRRDERVGLVLPERVHDLGQVLRGVLTVAVEEDDVVEVLLDRVEVAELLVPAVAPVVRRPEHAHVVKAQLLGGTTCGLEREIARRVVDHEDLGEEIAQPRRNPVEDAGDECSAWNATMKIATFVR